jgi:hypothetical protein
MDIPAYYGVERIDVSDKLDDSAFRFSGYTATFSSSILEKGKHTITLKIVTHDENSYYSPEQEIEFILQ